MYWSKTLIETLRESPAEAEIISHQLMLRAGLIRKVAAGIYEYLPLGWRVIKKIHNIVREEMDAAQAVEVMLPILSPAQLWQETGRWEQYGAELFRIQDRHKRSFALGPTHEEVITDLVRHTVTSYRQLPLNLYQMHTKFRDEIRPRFGIMRAREFIMKDAYSFDRDESSAEQSYQNMFDTYQRIFTRCGLSFKAVEADSGSIGGSFSSEFMVLADTGEEAIVTCTKCKYAANVEKAQGILEPIKTLAEAELELVATPKKHTVTEVAEFLQVEENQLAKTMLYRADDNVVAVVIRGDREINEIKLKNLLGVKQLMLASAADIESITQAPPGFAGPFNLSRIKELILDESLSQADNLITGGNKADTHARGVKPGRDFIPTKIADIKIAKAGDLCPKCKSSLNIQRGIEVGHVFKLGLKYSQAMRAEFLDEQGQKQLCVMGCYGIGISRIAAAAIEQQHDEKGIIWPMALAPYQVILLPILPKEPKAMAMAQEIYQQLQAEGIEALLDDRDERAGIKFKDADLLGIPIRLTFGKRVSEGLIELKLRTKTESEILASDKVIARIKDLRKEQNINKL